MHNEPNKTNESKIKPSISPIFLVFLVLFPCLPVPPGTSAKRQTFLIKQRLDPLLPLVDPGGYWGPVSLELSR